MPIEFPSGTAGDLPDMTIDTSNITVDYPTQGSMYYSTRIWHRQDGGVTIDIPGPDFFQTRTEQPTVTVTVNDFLASCSASDCTFVHQVADTPVANSLSSSLSSDNTELLDILGEGFVNDVTDYVITVGPSDCKVIEASSSHITCELLQSVAGTYEVDIVVKSKGRVEEPSILTHTVEMMIFDSTARKSSISIRSKKCD